MSEPLQRTRPVGPWLAAFALLATVATAPGCRGGSGPALRGGGSWVPPMLGKADKPSQKGLMSRWIGPSSPAADPGVRQAGGLVLGPGGWATREVDDDRKAEFEAAEDLFLKGDLDAAEKAFDRIARKEKNSSRPTTLLGGASAGLEAIDKPRSKWGMKALYYLGEIRFRKGDYVKSHDTFERLMKDYPGTPDLDEAVNREYQIGQIWMNQAHPQEGRELLPWYARFWGGLPMIDSGGSAVAAFEHVRQNDPTGELADDSVQQIADHYRLVGDHETAAFYYDQLINDHTKSPLLHDALLSSIDAKMNAYIGPEYDFSGLAEARQTVERTMQLFPEQLTSTSDDLFHKIDLIEDQRAERDFTYGQYFKSAGYVASAEYYFGGIVQKWPKSPWASKAKVELAALSKMSREHAGPSTIMTPLGSGDPYSSGISSSNVGNPMGGGMMPGAGMTGR